jgi:hypothetical protein
MGRRRNRPGPAARILSGAAAMLIGAVVWAGQWAAAQGRPSLRRLAIYYGIPSLVNGAQGDTVRAAAVFGEYDVVVFGDGLEFPDVVTGRTPAGAGPDERRNTAGIIRLMSAAAGKPVVFGYIDLGNSQNLSQREIERRIALWREMGVGGIFFDEAGFDFGVSRSRQNAAVDAVHAAGLRVFMNAFNPDDVFLPSDGLQSHLKAGDAFLLESFVFRNGTPDIAPGFPGWSARAARAVEYARRAQVEVHATATADGRIEFSSDSLAYAWWMALAYGLDGFGWGEPSFSGPTSTLPWRPRPEQAIVEIGERFVGALAMNDGVYSRGTDRGRIEVDTRARAGRFVPAR